jgi:hypothetical protein
MNSTFGFDQLNLTFFFSQNNSHIYFTTLKSIQNITGLINQKRNNIKNKSYPSS